ncbi:hypothetical protein V6N13_100448 [Hibiscus sabdariffa]
MQKNKNRTIQELMLEDMNQPMREFPMPTVDYQHQHINAFQGRKVDDSYEDDAFTSISVQLAELTNLVTSMLPPQTVRRVHAMAISCDYCGEHHLIGNCPYNPGAYDRMEDRSWNQQQNSSWYDQKAQNFFHHNNFVTTTDMPWQHSPYQEHSISLEETFQSYMARPDSLMEFNQSPQQCSNMQGPSKSMAERITMMGVLLREAEERSRRSTYAMDNMPKQLIPRYTEIWMQEVKVQCEENSLICGEQLELLHQEHVDMKECPNDLNQQIAIAMVEGPKQSNALKTLNETERSNALANSEESDAENDTTTLMLKQEYKSPSPLHVFLEEPTLLDLKLSTKWYNCLRDDTQSMVIPLDISATPKSLLMEMIEKSEEKGRQMREEFKTYGPSLDLHRIVAEDCHSNWLEHQLPRQRRLHPTMMEVNENKVIKWLDVDIIFHNNIFMPSGTIARWRVCMDYKGTRRKDTSTMVTKEGVAKIPLTQLFLGRLVTRWRVRLDYKKYRKRPSSLQRE